MIDEIKEALADFGLFLRAIVPPMIIVTLVGIFFTGMAALGS